MAEPNTAILTRRRFVSAASLALGAAANSSIVTPAAAYNPGVEETRARYRETPLVQTFYRVNGYETLNKSKP